MRRAAERTRVREETHLHFPGPVVRGRTRFSGACTPGHNVTPEAGYRTALLSDSPDEGVRYRPGGSGLRNDPDAKPECGTPRSERSAAAVVPSFKARQASRNANEGLTAFRPLARGTNDLRSTSRYGSRISGEKTTTQTTNITPVAAGICQSQNVISLKHRQFSAAACRYWVSIRYVGPYAVAYTDP